MAVNDIYRVRVICTKDDQIGVNVLHYRVVSNALPEPTKQEVANFLDAAFAPVYKPLLTSSAFYRGLGVQKIFPLPVEVESFSVANLGAGTVAGDELPKQVSGLLSYRTSFAGAGFRGRSYIPFAGESDNAAPGQPTGGYITRMVALGSVINSALLIIGGGGGSVTLQLVVFRRGDNTSTLVVAGLVRPFWATQRRRGDFGRPNTPPF